MRYFAGAMLGLEQNARKNMPSCGIGPTVRHKPNFRFDADWRARSVVVPCSVGDVSDFMRRHYLGKRPAVVVACFMLLIDGMARGCAVYALPPKQTAVRYRGLTWELARLFVDDEVPTNAETWLIASTVRAIRKAHPDVKALVSYADPSAGHAGTIYKAANWQPDGRTDQERKTPRFDYSANGIRYSRRSHVPLGAAVERVPRVSKHRFVLRIA